MYYLQLFEQNYSGITIKMYTIPICTINGRTNFATFRLCDRSRKVKLDKKFYFACDKIKNDRFQIHFRLKVTEDGKKALIKLANGDMRKVLNVLQSTWMAHKNVTEENVYLCVGHPTPSDIKTIINWLMSVDSFQECYESILFKQIKTLREIY